MRAAGMIALLLLAGCATGLRCGPITGGYMYCT